MAALAAVHARIAECGHDGLFHLGSASLKSGALGRRLCQFEVGLQLLPRGLADGVHTAAAFLASRAAATFISKANSSI